MRLGIPRFTAPRWFVPSAIAALYGGGALGYFLPQPVSQQALPPPHSSAAPFASSPFDNLTKAAPSASNASTPGLRCASVDSYMTIDNRAGQFNLGPQSPPSILVRQSYTMCLPHTDPPTCVVTASSLAIILGDQPVAAIPTGLQKLIKQDDLYINDCTVVEGVPQAIHRK